MIEVAQRGDVPVLCDMFLGHISANSEYISHGEIQMGVGVGRFVDGKFVTSVAPAAREQWLKYINGKIDSVDEQTLLPLCRNIEMSISKEE